MNLHHDTVSALEQNRRKFSDEVNTSIDIMLELIEKYSAMSDTGYLLHKFEKSFPAIRLPQGEGGWLPIRNLARIIAMIASMEFDDQINSISIDSMSCGCDYFEGSLSIVIGGHTLEGPYKWQWTAFPERIRSYKQFTMFPGLDPVTVS